MYAKMFDKPGKKVQLDRISPAPPKSLKRDKAEPLLAKLSKELFELQELMWGANTHSVLVVLQGRDAAGGLIANAAGLDAEFDRQTVAEAARWIYVFCVAPPVIAIALGLRLRVLQARFAT